MSVMKPRNLRLFARRVGFVALTLVALDLAAGAAAVVLGVEIFRR